MKVLVVGSGGREHTLCWKLAQSEKVSKLYALPGNAGMEAIAQRVPGSVTGIKAIADFAEQEKIDLTVIGPESPLIIGIVDEFQKRNLKVFGPNQAAAQMEGSKVFAKLLMKENNIPSAAYEVFEKSEDARKYIEVIAKSTTSPIVIKADGEAAGKGVFICKTKEEALNAITDIMDKKVFGESGNKVVIEDFLDGQEATFMCFVDGETFYPMPPSQDHKRAYDNDEGLNTGGMGCYSPVPALTPELHTEVIETIIKPTLKALKNKGIHYAGILYCGLALTSKGPKVIEFNVRFGDPETQVILPLLDGDLFDIMMKTAEGKLDETPLNWYNKKAVCVVMASGGYPGSYEKGKIITGIEDAFKDNVMVFHAGTETKDGNVVTSGGRVLGVTALGDSFQDCIKSAYEGVKKIHFDDVHYRNDIGARVL